MHLPETLQEPFSFLEKTCSSCAKKQTQSVNIYFVSNFFKYKFKPPKQKDIGSNYIITVKM